MREENATIPNRLQSDWTSPDQNRMSLTDDCHIRNASASRKILVEARNLQRSYGNQLAVKDVSFVVRSGDVLGLLGPNGAGKSTSMMMLAGLLAPDRGEVLLD